MRSLSYSFLLVALFGCAPSSDLLEVTGDVSWNGSPIPSGMVVLQPRDPRIAPAGGKIQDGQFKLQSKPGDMRVQIEAVRATNQIDPETRKPLGEMYIPAKYNSQTTLEANITRDGPNQLTFSLED